jgi:hypothetical protein
MWKLKGKLFPFEAEVRAEYLAALSRRKGHKRAKCFKMDRTTTILNLLAQFLLSKYFEQVLVNYKHQESNFSIIIASSP